VVHVLVRFVREAAALCCRESDVTAHDYPHLSVVRVLIGCVLRRCGGHLIGG